MHAFKCDRCGTLSEESGAHSREVPLPSSANVIGGRSVPVRADLSGFRVVVLVSGMPRDRAPGDTISHPQLCEGCFRELAEEAGDLIQKQTCAQLADRAARYVRR